MTDVPPGWERRTLASLVGAGFMRDGDWVESKDQDTSGSVRLTQLADVGVGTFRDRSDRWMRPDQVTDVRGTLLRPADVLIARMPEPIGRACLVPDLPHTAVTVVDVSVLRIEDPEVDPTYVMWGINSPQFRRDVQANQSGTTRKRISRRKLAELSLPVPPLAEQRRIVELLEDHFSRLDAADALLTNARVRRSALIRSLLESLVPDDVPADWRQSRVSEAGRTQLGRARHPDWHHGPEMRPYLRVANVFEDSIDESDVMTMDFSGVFEKYRLHDGDVLLNEGQSPHLLGRPAIYRGSPSDVAFTNSLIRFQANADVLPEWALLVFRRHMHSGRFRRESRITTNIAHLSMARLRTVEFPVPPFAEQAHLVAQAQAAFDGIGRLDNEVDGSARRSAALRRGLLDAAFNGRLTGKSLDVEIAEELADSRGAMA